MIGIFRYTDASNYKFEFRAEIPEGMKVGDETTLDKVGFTEELFFGKDRIVPYEFNDEDDHNIVVLVEEKPMTERFKTMMDKFVEERGYDWTLARAQKLNEMNLNLYVGCLNEGNYKEAEKHRGVIMYNKQAIDYLLENGKKD